MAGLSPIIYNGNIDVTSDVKSTIKSKYGDFVKVLEEISAAMLNDSEMVFPMFPNQKVKPSDASFGVLSSYTMDQLQQQMESLLDSVKKKSELDKMTYGLFG
ncbi:hypothetical protein A3K48_00945 [candidate division WOR-1 bacterium RIFOXYA12_FULL_52_29]|uniref:Uncharacterized protein n=1 Tax=candidate division WOR-1 bacterium RIFOXYC12_FULL_54_18 TaxID=1802584 RepID=A0A1F4T4T9_UNCSA|nr:MAG: hypothetical protein A3K44_00945 [candidate division WOR-1 bacterium RIFOXYA2_FULL_51_19]OGC17159.1 MAG: hypothetical protein A3K48_00945 [candidate division WOR-1 bacterium RIFOXYA12_FULL_52_29]OGC26019.1 MAG: hypothetical protein A3K32_00940 [candidate division WOR-1 bacterium RIFOXYB2_FULL_45_9]OGC27576.1 MAG: hypothetical protein A3K49_00945 [candidate division WOR-1 bacterium RIFOXYC12_FULL_54_18]OGC29211.1 MAG: hypothetical protein A2346_00765 [candidate division WOR-1 bacterium R